MEREETTAVEAQLARALIPLEPGSGLTLARLLAAALVPLPTNVLEQWATSWLAGRDSKASNLADLSVSWLYQNLPTNQITAVMELANNVFEDREIAKDWLNEPNAATDNRPPIALLGTEGGLLRVQTLLHRIEYGVLA